MEPSTINISKRLTECGLKARHFKDQKECRFYRAQITRELHEGKTIVCWNRPNILRYGSFTAHIAECLLHVEDILESFHENYPDDN